MFRHSRFIFLSITLLFVFLVSLARPIAVYADDSTPPPPATEEPTQPPPATEEPTAPPTEETPIEVESEAPSEVPVEVESEAPSSDTSTAPSAASEPVAVSEILEAAPEGTQVVVLDENGAALPLASEDAAEIVATVDPMWCPAGTLPGGVGCTINFASPQALIDNMDSSDPNSTDSIYEQDGIIYFTADPGGAFILTPGSADELQASDYNVLKVFNLTLQGGWNGKNYDELGFDISGQTDFGANRVQIGQSSNPWAGNITINNFSIDGVVNNTGLIVFTAGDINLNAVDSQNNAGNGARLTNTSGTGDVTVQDSSFNGNTETGLRVESNGDITLTDVTAQDNGIRGAILNNTTGSGNINISSSTFSGNVRRGVDAFSKGNITLSNVIAQNNIDSGAELDNCRADSITGICTGSGYIDVSSSTFIGNGDRGLVADSNGNITLFNVIANENIDSGAQLHNEFSGGGSITVNANIAGGTSFSGNGVDGLEAYSNGDITITNATVNGNAEIGASLINDTGEGNIFVSNSTFDSNTSTGQNVGLEITSGGDVTLSDVSASGNLSGSGSFIAASSLLIENSTFNNNASRDQAFGQGLNAEAEEAEIICSQFSGNSTYGIDGSLVALLTLDDVVFGGNGSGDYIGSAFVTSGGCESSEEGGGEEGGGEEGGGEAGESEEEGIEEGGGEEGVSEEEGMEVEEIEEEEGEGGGDSSGPDGASLTIIPVTGLPLHIVPVTGSEQIELDCNAFSGTKLILPNGDSVILPCPIRDQGFLTGQTQDELPGTLDNQFGFLSAMNAEVIRGGQIVSTLDAGMTVDFVIPSDQQNANLAILHWDGSQWVEVPGGHSTADGHFVAVTNLTGIFVLVTK